MNFHEILRRAFGFPSHPPFREDGDQRFRGPPAQKEDEAWPTQEPWSNEDEFSNVPSSPFGFRIFSGDPMEMHRYFEHQFDEIMKSFRAMQDGMFGSGLLDLPDLGEPPLGRREILPSSPSDGNPDFSPRDRYMKPEVPSISPPPVREDNDIDDRVLNGGGLDSVLPRRIFTGKSVISKIVRLPGGRIEEEKQVRGSDGSEEVTMTRRMGDRAHTVTTVKEAETGNTRQTETLVNMEEDELDDFEKNWKGQEVYKRSIAPSPQLDTANRNSTDMIFTILDRLFK